MIDSGLIIRSDKFESTVPTMVMGQNDWFKNAVGVRARILNSGQHSRQRGKFRAVIRLRLRKSAGGFRFFYFSIRESWIESSSACSTKCHEASTATTLRNLFLNAARLVPESIGNGPRLGKLLSA